MSDQTERKELHHQRLNAAGKSRRLWVSAQTEKAKVLRCARATWDVGRILKGEDKRVTVVKDGDGKFVALQIKNRSYGKTTNPIIKGTKIWQATVEECNCPDSPTHPGDTEGVREWLKERHCSQVTNNEGDVIEYTDVPLMILGPCRHMRAAELLAAGEANLFLDKLQASLDTAKEAAKAASDEDKGQALRLVAGRTNWLKLFDNELESLAIQESRRLEKAKARKNAPKVEPKRTDVQAQSYEDKLDAEAASRNQKKAADKARWAPSAEMYHAKRQLDVRISFARKRVSQAKMKVAEKGVGVFGIRSRRLSKAEAVLEALEAVEL